ncbi:MAG: RNA methyltransferase [Candidatus Brocadiaceae bacterium]|nr:RNA methyltransferase [Candidatus Brocadiaceae bacterium]
MCGGDVIDSLKHPAVVEARRLLRPVRGAPPAAFLADGCRLVRQAIEGGAGIEHLFFLDPVEGREAVRLLQAARAHGLASSRVRRGVFFRVLGLGYETSVQVLAVIRRPTGRPVPPAGDGATILLGERIQDPRNVGVLVRTADAWPQPHVVFSGDSADPWTRAAVRSSTGSIFRVPVELPGDLADRVRGLRAQSIRVIGASAHAAAACWETDLTGRCALLVGNETEGLSDNLQAACDAVVAIPMRGGAGSFNVTVAAGVLLYERARQMRAGARPRPAD